jgi:hypothetical protein
MVSLQMNSHFVTQINGDDWNIYLIPDHDEVIADETAAAATDFEKREMYFRRGEISLACARHEVFHAFAGYCYLGDTTSILISDVEEIFAALISDRGERIVEKSVEIYNKLVIIRNHTGELDEIEN